MNYATTTDITNLWRAMTTAETSRAESLIPVVCDLLRERADHVGKDLDAMISESPSLRNVAKSVVVDVVARALMTSTNQEPMTQMAQSALGYSVSGSFLVAGGGLFVKESEYAKLGLKRQKLGVIDLCSTE